MANPKEQPKKVSEETEEVVEETVEAVPEEVEEVSAEVGAQPSTPLEEVLGQAERAYAAFMEAQRQVASA